MALRTHMLVTVGLTAIFVSGCSLNLFNRGDRRAPPPTPVAAAPAGTVTGVTLAAPPQQGAPASGLAALDPSASNASTVPPAADSGELGRTDLLGGWTINAAGESCQLFMTLTQWTAGYRASTRGCTDASLQGISTWNLEGGQIQLMNDAGTTVARLLPTSRTQLDGQTPGGGPIVITR